MVIKMKNEINKNNNTKILRFILTVSIGFAVGGIVPVLGTIWIPRGNTYPYGLELWGRFAVAGIWSLYLVISFTIWGAIGGLAVGIAAKKDKMLFTLLGGIGFGIGTVAMVSVFNRD